ncbi:MAG TPA: hypothetical protein VD902_13710 [Symbiobacteriaceae bacterium]|nr:hypothetical protein [Symbiobacteriaceae bacterium]
MRRQPWLWIVAGFLVTIVGVSWYIGRVNTTHPAPWPNAGGDSGFRNAAGAPMPAAVTGEKRVTLDSNASASAPVVGVDGTIYIANGSKVLAYSQDLKRRWAWDSRARINAVALGRQGQVFALSEQMLYALSPEGALRWQKELDISDPVGFFVGQGGTIYASGTDMLYAFADDGTVKWRFRGENMTAGPIELSSGRLAVVIGRTVYVLDRYGETVRSWPLAASNSTFRLAAGPGGALFVTTGNQFLRFNAQGQLQETTDLEPSFANFLAAGKGFTQVGYTRWTDDMGDQVWRVPASADGRVAYVVVDSAGNTLVYEWSPTIRRSMRPQWRNQGNTLQYEWNPVVRRTDMPTLRLLDSKGNELWARELTGLANLPAVTGTGSICYPEFTEAQGLALTCLSGG